MHVERNVNINAEITPVENEVKKCFEVGRCFLLNISFNAYLNIKEVGNLGAARPSTCSRRRFQKPIHNKIWIVISIYYRHELIITSESLRTSDATQRSARLPRIPRAEEFQFSVMATVPNSKELSHNLFFSTPYCLPEPESPFCDRPSAPAADGR